jgi:hypothetical protein
VEFYRRFDAKSHTRLYADSIKAIKFTMARHNEYQGIAQ